MTDKAEFERLLDVYGFRCERFGQDLSTHARAQVVSAFAALASAPVADEWVLPPLPAAWGSAINDAGDGHVDLYSAEQMQEYTRAALASTPVAEPETMEEIHRQERERSPWKLPKDPTLPDCAPVTDESPMAKMADALREKARQEQQAYQDRRNQATEWGPIPEGTEADSAPVAGEAQPVAKVVDGGQWGPTLRFVANGKSLPKVGTLLYAAPQASEAVPQAAIYISTEHLRMLQSGELGQLCALHGSNVLRSVPGPGLSPLFALPPTSEDVDAVIGSLMCRANSAEKMWRKCRDKCAQLEANSDRYLFLRDHASHSWAGWIDTNNPGPKERPDSEIDEWIAKMKQEGDWNYQADEDGGDCAKGAGDEVTPEMLRAAQMKSELGGIACADYSGGYDLITELYQVMYRAALSAQPGAQRTGGSDDR